MIKDASKVEPLWYFHRWNNKAEAFTSQDLAGFIKEFQSNKDDYSHITYESLDRYRTRGAKIDNSRIILFMEVLDTGEIVGISCIRTDGKGSITLVCSKHRGKGIGSKLLKKKMQECKKRGIPFTTKIDRYNTESLKMADSVGLKVKERQGATATFTI